MDMGVSQRGELSAVKTNFYVRIPWDDLKTMTPSKGKESGQMANPHSTKNLHAAKPAEAIGLQGKIYDWESLRF